MKKRYIVAATAALVGGGLLVEMQVGSKGLDRIELAASGGGGLAAGGPRAGGADGAVTVRAAVKSKAPPVAAPAAIEPVEEAVLLNAAADDTLGLMAKISIWGEPTFDAVLLQRGFAEAPAPRPGADALAGFGRGIGGSYPLAGDINRASGADALTTALSQPQASSMVPEPATWLSMIVGLAMVGFSLRGRQGRRSVAS